MRGRNRALWECPEHMSQIEKAGEGFVEEGCPFDCTLKSELTFDSRIFTGKEEGQAPFSARPAAGTGLSSRTLGHACRNNIVSCHWCFGDLFLG